MFAARVLHTDAPPPRPLNAAPASSVDDTARLLELFAAAPERPLSIADLQRDGIDMPGQALYELQLAGYRIGRIYGRDEQHRRTLLGYRLDHSASRPTAASPTDVSGVHAAH